MRGFFYSRNRRTGVFPPCESPSQISNLKFQISNSKLRPTDPKPDQFAPQRHRAYAPPAGSQPSHARELPRMAGEIINPNLHVVFIHYPLGLLVAGTVIELFSFLWPRSGVRAA